MTNFPYNQSPSSASLLEMLRTRLARKRRSLANLAAHESTDPGMLKMMREVREEIRATQRDIADLQSLQAQRN